MSESAVVNASPLIFLSRIKRLDFLQLICDRITVPYPVADEIRQYGSKDPTAIALETHEWLVVDSSSPIDPKIHAWDLGPGEESVIQWAYSHPDCIAIIDDLAGRRCADALAVPVVGTLGLVLSAKRRGVIKSARPVVEHLQQLGMYLSPQVITEALRRVGE